MGYTFSKTGSDLKKEVTGKEIAKKSKMGHSIKNGLHLQKWITLGK